MSKYVPNVVSEEAVGGLTVRSEPGRVVEIVPRGRQGSRSGVFMWAERGEVDALIRALRRAERHALKASTD